MRIELKTRARLLLATVIVMSSSEAQVAAIAEHMHGHLDAVVSIKAAVISGNLEGVRSPATWLAEHKAPSEFPEEWVRYETEMRRFANQAASADDLETAAAAISEIGRTCGDCHIASGIVVSFGYANQPPPDQSGTITQMQRHLWAADRMWAALIGPSDAAWDSGTEMLTQVNLSATQLTQDPRQRPRVEELLDEARAVGERGARTTTSAARTNLYGQFLSSCANCHRVTGGGPRW